MIINEIFYYYKELEGKISYLAIENYTLHRDNGPAFSSTDYSGFTRKWFKDGLLHSYEGGPAIIRDDLEEGEIKEWYKDGLLHRDGGPAHISLYGYAWYKNGKLHREDGPAVFNAATKELLWYLEDKKIEK